jgi:beta-lactamase superfamily II metal-dependent hydrolase
MPGRRSERWVLATVLAAALLVAGSGSAIADTVTPRADVRARVNVRQGPSLDAPVVASLAPGDSGEWLEELAGWYRIRMPDGTEGYVSASWTRRVQFRAAFRVAIADVGTGLAVFVRGEDFALIYDAGSYDDSAVGRNDRFVAFLTAIAPDLQEIDTVVLSHPHRGHVEFLADVFARYRIRNVLDSGAINPICGYHSFIDAVAREPGVAYRSARNVTGSRAIKFGTARQCEGRDLPKEIFVDHGDPLTSERTISLGKQASLRVLHADGSRRPSFDDNSMVVRLDLGASRVLLVGDASAGHARWAEEPAPNSVEGKLLAWRPGELEADVLVVGNHGAAESAHPAFLDAVGAGLYVISAGPEPLDGRRLPDARVVAELARRGRVLRTDLDDQACAGMPAKIGPDADGRPGGCDNVSIEIDSHGAIRADYWRRAD